MSATAVMVLVLSASLFGCIVGYLIRMMVENTAETQIRQFIVFGINQFFSHKNVTVTPVKEENTAVPPGGIRYSPPNAITPMPVPRPSPPTMPLPDSEAIAALRQAMENPRSEDDAIEDILAAYDPKKIRAALSRMQVRAGGKFAKA